jgi:DNA invertase Pin-like site-specific DNA recombinase
MDKVFTDKASGKGLQRPELDVLLSFVREEQSKQQQKVEPGKFWPL